MELDSHARSELIGNSDEKFEFKSLTAQPGYGLRENPKKTWRADDLKTHSLINEQQERFCKQCGKGFRSIKALCGHMACHSTKDRFLKEDDTWTSERAVEGRKKWNRAATMRYNKGLAKSCFDSDLDIEQEEVAMCLIMLSKDYRNCESSDSVVLEAKSSSIDTKIGQDYLCESDEKKRLGNGKLKSRVFDSENDESADGYLTVNDFKKQKLEGGSRFKVNDFELGGKLKQDKCRAAALGIGLSKDSNRSAYKSMNFVSKNKKRQKAKKTKTHDCPYCDRVFKSGQALGGHKRTHFLGSNAVNRNNHIATVVFEIETSEVKDLLDLNLPAPEEEEKSEHYWDHSWRDTRLPINDTTSDTNEDGTRGLIIDSGTTLALLEKSAFELGRKALISEIKLEVDNSNSDGLLCFKKPDTRANWRSLGWFSIFKGQIWNFRPENYLVTSLKGVMCLVMCLPCQYLGMASNIIQYDGGS